MEEIRRLPEMTCSSASGQDRFPPMGTIRLNTSFFPLAFILFLFPAKARVDGGEEIATGWGTNDIPVTAGSHRLTVYFPYLFVMKQAGKGEIEVNVAEGETVNVRYRAPWIVFLAGKLQIQ